MTNAVYGQGLVLKRGQYTIAEVTDISGPSMTLKTLDVTSHSSTGGYSEFIAGLKDAGDLVVKGNFYAGDTNGQIGLRDDFNNNTVRDYTLQLASATGAAWTFSGFITKFETQNPLDKEVTFAATIKISGQPTLNLTYSSNLSGLTISSGSLTPAFAAAKYDYADLASANFTVTATGSGVINLYVNNIFTQLLTTGVPSGTISIASGEFKKIQVVVQETGKVPVTYTMNVARA